MSGALDLELPIEVHTAGAWSRLPDGMVVDLCNLWARQGADLGEFVATLIRREVWMSPAAFRYRLGGSE